MLENLSGKKIIVLDSDSIDRNLLELAVKLASGSPINLRSIYFLQTVTGANGLLLATTLVDSRDVNLALYYLSTHPISAIVTTSCMHDQKDEEIVKSNPHVTWLEGKPHQWQDRAVRALAQALNQQQPGQ